MFFPCILCFLTSHLKTNIFHLIKQSLETCIKIGLLSLTSSQSIIINDVPLMEPIAPHHTALRLLKIPDIVKLNTLFPFYDYFNVDKHENWNLSLVSKLHDYDNQSVSSNLLAIPFFFKETPRKFVQQLSVDVCGMTFLNQLEKTN